MPSELIFFHKGLDYSVRSALQSPGSLQTAENIIFRTEGVQELRPAFTDYNEITEEYILKEDGGYILKEDGYGVLREYIGAIHTIKRFMDWLIISDNQNVRYRAAASTGDFTGLYAGFENNPWNFSEYKDFLHGVNGTNSFLIDEYANMYPALIANPITAPTLADSGVAGNPDDTYVGYVTYLIIWPNGNKYETGLSTGSADVTVATNKITWSDIPVCPYTEYKGVSPVIHRKLYRGPGTGATIADIYLVTTIEDNHTTTYTDNISDATIIANGASYIDDYAPHPSNPKYVAYHYSRCFMISGDNINRLYYSDAPAGDTATDNEVLMPLMFPDNNWDDLRSAGYDGYVDPQGIISWGTSLYIPLKHTWIKKSGNDPDTWGYKKTWADLGISAPDTVRRCSRLFGILGIATSMGGIPGISLFNGQTSQMIASPQLDYIFEEDLNQDAIANCRAEWDGRYYHLLYPHSTNTQPSKWLAVDLSRFPDVRVAHWEDLSSYCIDVYKQGSGVYAGGSDGIARYKGGTESIKIDVKAHDAIGGSPELANTQKTLKKIKYSLISGTQSEVYLEISIDGTAMTWPDGNAYQVITGTDDSVQYLNAPPNFEGFKFAVRAYETSGQDDFELYSPWELIFDV